MAPSKRSRLRSARKPYDKMTSGTGTKTFIEETIDIKTKIYDNLYKKVPLTMKEAQHLLDRTKKIQPMCQTPSEVQVNIKLQTQLKKIITLLMMQLNESFDKLMIGDSIGENATVEKAAAGDSLESPASCAVMMEKMNETFEKIETTVRVTENATVEKAAAGDSLESFINETQETMIVPAGDRASDDPDDLDDLPETQLPPGFEDAESHLPSDAQVVERSDLKNTLAASESLEARTDSEEQKTPIPSDVSGADARPDSEESAETTASFKTGSETSASKMSPVKSAPGCSSEHEEIRLFENPFENPDQFEKVRQKFQNFNKKFRETLLKISTIALHRSLPKTKVDQTEPLEFGPAVFSGIPKHSLFEFPSKEEKNDEEAIDSGILDGEDSSNAPCE